MKNALLIGVFSLAVIIGSSSCNDQNPEEAVSWEGIEENVVYWNHSVGQSVLQKKLSLLDSGEIAFGYKTDNTIQGLLRVPDVDNVLEMDVPVPGDYFYFIIKFKDLPVSHTDKGIKLSCTYNNAEFHPQLMDVEYPNAIGLASAIITEDCYKGVMECSGTMDYLSDTELSGEWLFRIIMNDDEQVVIRVNKLNIVDYIYIPAL